MKILITGANGMVARAAAEHCRSIGDDVVALTRQELDIADRNAVLDVAEGEGPEIVLNCAAYTNVDGAETNIDQCYAANAAGPENLALASKQIGCVLVTISTDYVFDGGKDGFYTQEDPPAPQSVYARSKLDGEVRTTAANPDAIIVRTGWIYGDRGTNFLSEIYKLLAAGKRITAIGDSFGTPTYAVDLAARLRELAGLRASGIFHVTNSGDGTSYLKFAQTVADLGGFEQTSIEEISMKGLNRPAERPVNSRLACLRSSQLGLAPLQNWTIALQEFLRSTEAK